MKYFPLLLCLALANCATEAQAIRVTGASLDALGATFEVVGPAVKTACLSKTLAPADCAAFKVFGKKFQAAYPLAVDLWKVADTNQDAKLEGQVGAMIGAFSADLSAFSALVGVK